MSNFYFKKKNAVLQKLNLKVQTLLKDMLLNSNQYTIMICS